MFSIIKKTISELMYSKIKFFLTIGGIAAGIMSVIIIYSVGEIGKFQINSMLEGMGLDSIVISGNISNTEGLNENDLENVKNMNEVKNAMPLMNTVTYCSSDDDSYFQCMLWGVNEDADNVIDLDVEYGRMINKGDVINQSQICIIDSSLADDIYKNNDALGKTLGVVINGKTRYYVITGIVDNGVSMLQSMLGGVIPSFVYIPYTSMQNDTAQYCFNQIAVKINDDNNNSNIKNDIEQTVVSKRDIKSDITVSSFLSQKDTLSEILTLITVILTAIAAISLIVSGFSIMNIMLSSVKERTREIGIKKSLGAKNTDIAFEFLAESAAITFTGGVIGEAAGTAIAFAGCLITGTEIFFNAGIIVYPILFAVLTGLIFGVYPAYKAGKLNPCDAFRN